MRKVIQNGRVRVLYSPGWGSGFLTCGAPIEAIFDPELIQLIDEQNLQEAVDYVVRTYGCYTGGVPNLCIAEIPEGTRFIITEYDGSESIDILEEMNWITA